MHKIENGIKIELTPEEESALLSEWARNTQELDNIAYINKRLHAYPPLTDQLDAILKQLNYMQMSGQTNIIKPMDDIIQKWLQVKRDFPKPGE